MWIKICEKKKKLNTTIVKKKLEYIQDTCWNDSEQNYTQNNILDDDETIIKKKKGARSLHPAPYIQPLWFDYLYFPLLLFFFFFLCLLLFFFLCVYVWESCKEKTFWVFPCFFSFFTPFRDKREKVKIKENWFFYLRLSDRLIYGWLFSYLFPSVSMKVKKKNEKGCFLALRCSCVSP